jgi:hypothetical protein
LVFPVAATETIFEDKDAIPMCEQLVRTNNNIIGNFFIFSLISLYGTLLLQVFVDSYNF